MDGTVKPLPNVLSALPDERIAVYQRERGDLDPQMDTGASLRHSPSSGLTPAAMTHRADRMAAAGLVT